MTWIWLMALFFAFWSSAYFGRHWTPQSDAELIADGLVLLLCALAVVAGRLERK